MRDSVEQFIPAGMGWQPDLPDLRDYTAGHPSLQAITLPYVTERSSLPTSVDLRCDAEGVYLPFPGDQGRLNLSCAFTCLGLFEYFQRRVLGQAFSGSPFFVYQMTRRMMNVPFNASVNLRTTFKAIRRYGTPPESMCRAEDNSVAELTDISLLGFRKDWEDFVYFKPVLPNQYGQDALFSVKAFVAAGYPIAMGFSVPSSIDNSGRILWRPCDDAYLGGQAALIVGYDDNRISQNRGALLLRSSWGSQWGENGAVGYLTGLSSRGLQPIFGQLRGIRGQSPGHP